MRATVVSVRWFTWLLAQQPFQALLGRSRIEGQRGTHAGAHEGRDQQHARAELGVHEPYDRGERRNLGLVQAGEFEALLFEGRALVATA